MTWVGMDLLCTCAVFCYSAIQLFKTFQCLVHHVTILQCGHNTICEKYVCHSLDGTSSQLILAHCFATFIKVAVWVLLIKLQFLLLATHVRLVRHFKRVECLDINACINKSNGHSVTKDSMVASCCVNTCLD